MTKTFVYVISGEHGRQKIGCSDDPRARIKSLQTGSPYPLKFEFIGETENFSGGAIEVEAHFMLNAHKAPGGDEWFTVPPDVAITAVMAAAHRLGHRCKPIDIDSAVARSYQIGMPSWQKWLLVPIGVAALALFIPLLIKFDTGQIDGFLFILGGICIAGGVKLLHKVLVSLAISLRLAPS